MMDDRTLLERAAKAAGYKALEWHREIPREGGSSVCVLYVGQCEAFRPFSPLEDDGDALRLAVKLRLSVDAWGSGAAAVVSLANRAMVAEPHYGDDPERATRRAIVRAAASMAGE